MKKRRNRRISGRKANDKKLRVKLNAVIRLLIELNRNMNKDKLNIQSTAKIVHFFNSHRSQLLLLVHPLLSSRSLALILHQAPNPFKTIDLDIIRSNLFLTGDPII